MRSRRRKIFEKRNKSTTNCFFSSIKFEPCIFLKTNFIFIHVLIIKITIEAVEKRMQKAEKRKKQTIAWETINVDSLRVSYSHVGGVRHTCIVHACETVFPIFPFAISPHGSISFRAHPLAGCCVDRRCRWYSLDRLIHRITTVWPSVRNRGCHEIVRR